VALGLAAGLADGVSTGLVVLLLYSIIGRAGDLISANGFLGRILPSINSTFGNSVVIAILIVAFLVANIGLTFIYTVLTANIRYRLSESVRNSLSRQFFDVSYDFILRHDHGQLLNVWNGESWLIGDMYLYVSRLLINLCASITFLLFLGAVSWRLLAISATGITLLFVMMHRLSGPARELGRKMKKEHEKLAERMLVTLHGMRALRAFAQESHYQQGFERASAEVRRTSLTFERLYALVSPAVQLGYLLLLAATVFAGQLLGISFAATLAFVALLYRFQPHVRELQSNLLSIAQLQASVASVVGMLERSDKTYVASGSTRFSGLRNEIRFDEVSFTYAGASSSSLDGVSFAIPAGSVTALVGVSGAGKTTIVNLLLGLYRPASGTILVDGVRLDELHREEWLSKIAAAGQDVELVEGTVADNLRLANPHADFPAMRIAAEAASILETIEDLPQGFESWIGQQGLKLSAGQRQRFGARPRVVARSEYSDSRRSHQRPE